jgi:hypothetical protein
MSVAHNTITADELRQDQATGKLVAWKEGDNYVAVSASAGTAYKVADLTRSILVTDDYVLQVDRAHSTDGRPHVFDLNYHNYGKQTMQLPTTPYSGFSQANGYTHLEQVQRGETSDKIMTRFENEGTTLSLTCWVAYLRKSFRGCSGTASCREGAVCDCATQRQRCCVCLLLVPSKGQRSTITVKRRGDDTFTVRGPHWVDSVTLDNVIRYHRSIVADRSGAPGD